MDPACDSITTLYGRKSTACMNRLILSFALPLMFLPAPTQTRVCLRVMPIEELARSAILIARVKVARVDRANYRGMFGQVAAINPTDVIEGDFTLKVVYVLARSNVMCAEDNYTVGQEMLVFLEPEESLFHTLNYQYGQFRIVGDIVQGWRDKDNKPVDKPYGEVRQEIENYLNAIHTPQPEPSPPSPPSPPPPAGRE